jgi:integrase
MNYERGGSTPAHEERPESDEIAPHEVWTKYQIRVDTRLPEWRLDGRRPVDVGQLRDIVAAALLEGLNETLRSCVAKKMSYAALSSIATSLKHYHRTMHAGGVIDRWTKVGFTRYRKKLIEEFGNESYLITIRPFLIHWSALRQPGVEPEVIDALKAMRLKRGDRGRPIASMDPRMGPFTPEELRAISADLYRASEGGQVSLEDTSLLTFHIVTGRRPEQSGNLKCSDIDRSRRQEPDVGEPERAAFIIAVPRIKERGAGFRESLRGVHTEEAIFALMEAQKGCAQAQFRQLLAEMGIEIQSHDLEDLLKHLPVYPDWATVRGSVEEAARLSATGQHGRAVECLHEAAIRPVWHLRAQYITRRLKRIVASIGTKSSRTGRPLNVTAYRFRYSKGTELARLGIGLEVLAWLMDHSSVLSARAYVANLPEHGAWINDALRDSSVLRGIALAFTPSLVEADDPGECEDVRRATEVHYKGKRALKCGIQRKCRMGAGIPLACYTCNNFRPWVDGPHEQVLEDLLRDRAEDAKVLGEKSPVTRRRDNTIVAVIITMHRCQERREQLAQSSEAV